MTDNADTAQETTDDKTGTGDAIPFDNSGGKGDNPFRKGPKPPPKPKTTIFDSDFEDEGQQLLEEPSDEEPKAEPAKQKQPVDKGASLDEIDDVTVLRKMVKDTRREAAKARTEKNSELKEFEAWKDAQKTEAERAIEKAQDRARAAEERADKLLIENLQREFNIADEMLEFLSGDTEAEMRAKAEKLGRPKEVAEVKETPPAEQPAEKLRSGPGLLGGKRGEPLGKAKTTSDWFTELMRNA